VVHLLARVVLDAARDEVEQRERVPLVGALLGVGLCPVRAPAAGAGLSAPPGLRADRGAHFAPPFSASIIPIVFVYCAASRLAVLSSLAAFAVPQALCEATVLGRPASSPGSSSAARSTSRRAFAAKSSRVATACRQASITLSRYCAAECSAKRSVASVFVVSLVVCASIFASVCGASECARSSAQRGPVGTAGQGAARGQRPRASGRRPHPVGPGAAVTTDRSAVRARGAGRKGGPRPHGRARPADRASAQAPCPAVVPTA